MRWAYLDTETHLITPGRLAPKLVCVQLAVDGGDVAIHVASDPATRDVVEDVLKTCQVVGHNIAYDLAVISAQWPDLMPLVWSAYNDSRVFDTMITWQMHDISKGTLTGAKGAYSLKTLAGHAGFDLSKGSDSWQLRYAELDGVPLDQWPADALRYATLDVQATRAVWAKTMGLCEELGQQPTSAVPTLDVQTRAAWALHLAACWGMRCDPVEVGRLRQRLLDNQASLKKGLVANGMLRADGTRDDNAVRARAAASGATKTTEKGKTSISAAALQDVQDDVLGDLVAFQQSGKILSTYLPVVERGCREPLHARYGLVASGRTSCQNPNLQNLPRNGGVRETFVPRSGFVYLSADYSGVELVCLAQLLATKYGIENSWLAQSLLSGKDLHLVTAAQIIGCGYDEAKTLYAAGDRTVKEARQLAKGLNFGIPGGLGADKLRVLLRGYGFDVSLERARYLKAQWLLAYPEMRLYFQHIGNQCGNYRDGDTFDVHPVTGFERGGLDYCSLANHGFQHLAAYGAKIALYSVQRACFSEGFSLYGSRLVAFVHDEFLLEVPESNLADAAKELTLIMCSEFTAACPDIPVNAEAVAMRRWCKDAKPRYDRDGNLIPWEP